jgi:hypothetical protein
MRSLLESSVLNVAKEQRGIIAMFASYGTTTLTKTYITAMIVEFVGRVVDLERTSSIARSVYFSETLIKLTNQIDLWCLHVRVRGAFT